MMGNTFDDGSRLVGEIRSAGFGVNVVVDVSWLTVGDGLQLGDRHSILQLHLVDRDCAVQEWDGHRTCRAASKDIFTLTEFCCKLELLSLIIYILSMSNTMLLSPKKIMTPSSL